MDFLGAGKIVGEISKFVLSVTDRWLAREDRALAREQVKQKIRSQKIKNAEALMKLAGKHLDEDAKRLLLRRVLEMDDYIETNILDGKITSVTPIDPNSIPTHRRRVKG